MASLAWTDAIGAATLTNGLPAPADRFDAWTPRPGLEADARASLGTGAYYVFSFGDRYDASFALSKIPNPSQALAARLVRHLLNGGVVSVTTDDIAAHVYPTCQMVAGSPPTLELSDRVLLEWTLTLTLRNVAAVPAELVCVYA